MASCLGDAVHRNAWSPGALYGRQHGYRLQDLNINKDWLPGPGEDQQAVADAAVTGLMEGRLAVLAMRPLHCIDASLA